MRIALNQALSWNRNVAALANPPMEIGSRVESFATHRMPLSEAASAYDMFRHKRDGACKIVFTP